MKEAEKWSRRGLWNYNKLYSARGLRHINHHKLYLLLGIFIVFLMYAGYSGLVIALNLFSFSYFLYRLTLFTLGAKGDNNSNALDYLNADLPTYCILLPLRDEPLSLTQTLIKNISNLQYDKSKLDVILLIDQGDPMLEYIGDIKMPDYFRIISAENILPFTKPKVCNLGLFHTEADIVTIYDAEDCPESDQLLRVVEKFNLDQDLKCVQCELHFKNKGGNLISAFFSLEYLVWFSFLLKGLRRSMKLPLIPLGGTSQHIKVDYLKSLGGWDAYNVTEDADLGVRILREGGKITTVDSVTYEIAPTSIDGWIKQRTRWNLGYLITSIVHTRSLRKLVSDIGIYRTIHLIINLPLSVIHSAITPILLTLFIVSFFYQTDSFTVNILPKITLIGNYVILVITTIIASLKRGELRLMLSLVFPLYYLLHPVSAIRSLYKLKVAPFQWEKTCKKEFN